MKIALVQMAVEQGNFDANLEKAQRLAARAKSGGAQLAVFPEMFVCGFNYRINAQYLEQKQTELVEGVRQIAQKNDIFVCGSIPYAESGNTKPFNRILFVDNLGEIRATYDKLHLFSLFKEDKYSRRGETSTVADTALGRIGFAVCYDLRFPELFSKMARQNAQLVILPAAWPKPRDEHWNTLVRARAIENQYFVAAVNQGGVENFGDKKAEYFGMSQLVDPWGEVLALCPKDSPDTIAFADVDYSRIDDARAKIPSSKDRRDDIY